MPTATRGPGTQKIETIRADPQEADRPPLRPAPPRRTDRVPAAVGHFDELRERIDDRRIAVFLDQDGTLAPITERPEEAVVPRATRDTIERLAAVCPVHIVTGRDVTSARHLLGLDSVTVIGNHGLETARPGAPAQVDREAERHVTRLRDVGDALERRLAHHPGAWVERKRFSVVAHDRQVPPERLEAVHREVDAVASEHPGLRLVRGRRIHEFRPPVAVDKGVAVLRRIEALGGSERVCGIYVGDDTTDEDAFRALSDDGVGIVVRDGGRLRPTWAHYGIGGPHEVPELLELLWDLAQRTG